MKLAAKQTQVRIFLYELLGHGLGLPKHVNHFLLPEVHEWFPDANGELTIPNMIVMRFDRTMPVPSKAYFMQLLEQSYKTRWYIDYDYITDGLIVAWQWKNDTIGKHSFNEHGAQVGEWIYEPALPPPIKTRRGFFLTIWIILSGPFKGYDR